jgi:hypothetical protein
MEKQKATILNIAGGVLIGLLIAGMFAFDDKTLTKKEKSVDSEPTIKYYAPAHPAELSFAGEKVPLERWDVKERFDRELLFNYYNKANMLFLLKLANRYFPTISERLKANGVPDDLNTMRSRK